MHSACRRNLTATAGIGVLAIATTVCGQSDIVADGDTVTDSQKGNALDVFSGSFDDVLGKLNYNSFDRRSLTTFGAFTAVRAELQKLNKTLEKAANLRIGFAWTGLYQHATKSTSAEDAASGDFDFFGRWRPLHTRETMGFVIFETEMRHKLGTDITPSQLGTAIGSLWGTTSGFNTEDFYLKQLYWQQFLLKNTLTYRVGKLDLSNVFNVNRLDSANLFFLNEAFTDNPTMPYPPNGFGADLTWRPARMVYLAFGAANTDDGTLNDIEGKLLQSTDWFMAAEVGITPWLDGLGAGHYRFTGWYTSTPSGADVQDSSGFAISCDQQLGQHWMAFLRYDYGDGNLTQTKQVLAGGFGIRRPIGENDDFAGIGFAWGEATDPTLRNQWVAESFYRFQLTPAMQLTADAQLIVNPSNLPAEETIGVFGVRLRITF